MKSFLVILALALASNAVNSQKQVGCYWGAWTSISQINIKICTHAYFAFYVTDANGVITSTAPGNVQAFLALRSQNPSVKLIASIGGATAGTWAFTAVASNLGKTATFVNNAVALAVNSGFDGIDIDWEYPEPHEKTTFVNFLGALKPALNAKGKVLAIASAAGTWRVGESYNIAGVCKNVDIMNLMSYDMQWPYTITGPNAGYAVIDNAVSIWINGGCPPSKLVLGLASYGYNFNLANPSATTVGSTATGATSITYRDICKKLKSPGWKTMQVDQTPVSYNGNEWISYDDVNSLAAKLKIVSTRGLAGAFFWSTEQDDYDNSCGYGAFPLITSVYKALTGSSGSGGAVPVPTQGPVTQAPVTQAPVATTASSSTTFTCGADGFYACPGDCTKYYRCVGGTAYLNSCPTGLGWQQSATSCNWKSAIPGCV